MKFKQFSKISLLFAVTPLVLLGCNSDSDKSNNQQPKIISTPITSAVEDILYTYQLEVKDPDDENNGSDLIFSLNDAPEGMSISPTGKISWTPTEGVLSSEAIMVSVEDGLEDGTEPVKQTFTISVTPVNDSPILDQVSDQIIENGQSLVYQLIVSDSDDENNGSDITFMKIEGPENLTISSLGEINYTSGIESSRSQTVTIQAQDGGEDNAQPFTMSFKLEEKYFYQSVGILNHYYDNSSVADGTIKLSINGQMQQELTSNQFGEFELKLSDQYKDSMVTLSADAEGYAESSKNILAQDLPFNASLRVAPVHDIVSFNTEEDSELKVEEDILVKVSANSLQTESGQVFSGTVKAELTIIDPVEDLNLMPGEMITTNQSGEIEQIESFGAITVSFTDNDGNKLQIADNKTAEIRIPSAGNNPPETIPLYYFDEIKGLWIEEGEANLVNNLDGSRYYQGVVSHFTTWNADQVINTTYIHGCIEDIDGEKLSNIRVTARGQDYSGESSGYTNDDGYFSIPAKRNSTVLMYVSNGYASRTLELNVSNEDLTLEECLKLEKALTSIKLNWGENPSDLDTHFFGPDENNAQFHVSYSDKQVVVNDSNIVLDVDDINGYGPEILSVSSFPFAGDYNYYVYKYSGLGDIATGQARVELTMNTRVTLFTPPTGEVKDWWHVFNIQVNEEGEITVNPINTWVDEPVEESVNNYTIESADLVPSRMSIKADKKSTARELLEKKYYSHKK